MSSTSSTTSPEDAGGNAVEETTEDATRPFPASDDTRPLTQPLTQPLPQSPTTPRPASNDASTDVLSTKGAPGGTDQAARPRDADAEGGAVAQTDVLPSPASSSPSNHDGFSAPLRCRSPRSGWQERRGQQHIGGLGSRAIGVQSRMECRDGGRQGSAAASAPGHQGLHTPVGGVPAPRGRTAHCGGPGTALRLHDDGDRCLAGLGILLVIVALIPKRRSGIKP